MDEPLVSILTPTYNHEAYIAQAVESVLAQDYPNWEQIVLDDESTDRTPEIISRYRDPRVRSFRQKHRGFAGLAETYNDGLRLARGSLIAILEGDDYWPSGKLARLVPAFRDPRIVLAYGITQPVNALNQLWPRTIPSRRLLRPPRREVLFNDPVGSAVREMCKPDEGGFTFPCSTLIRRSALEECGGFVTVEDRHAVDYATFMTLATRGRFHFVPEIAGYYRRHLNQANSSRGLEGMLRADYRFCIRFLREQWDRLPQPLPSLDCVRRRWERLWSAIRLGQGRILLLTRRWAEARAELARVFQTPYSAMQALGAGIGMACSLIHRDLEPFYRARRPGTSLPA
ncbi:MAG: glycosyltransferase family 2 protein [Planctomycetes bacterium]|nr:glycosyltransferase family 2 protein [Planctomycetota bacterium]